MITKEHIHEVLNQEVLIGYDSKKKKKLTFNILKERFDVSTKESGEWVIKYSSFFNGSAIREYNAI